MKLDPSKGNYGQEWWWVGHPDAPYYPCDNPRSYIETMLVKRRYEIEIIGGVQDEEASYSYDDWALCKLDGQYYLLSTSGCSCPSPSETWRLEIGPATLGEIERHVRYGDYDGYTVPKRQEDDFLKLLSDEAAANCGAHP